MSETRTDTRTTDRVALVHRQTRPTLAVAAAFIVAAPIAAALPHDTGVWLPLHLFLVGGLLSAISGTTQMLSVTWSTSPAPPDRPVALQRAAIASGTLLLVTGRELGHDAVAATGGAVVALGLALLAGLLWRIRSTARLDRYRPAIDGYLLALAFGAAGVAIGVHVATGGTASGDLRHAHLVANLLGLVGLTVLATLPYFTATQVRSKVAPRATPGRVRALVVAAASTIAAATAAAAAGWSEVAGIAVGLDAVAILAVIALLPRLTRRQLEWAGARLVQLLAGIAWWAGTTVGLAVAIAGDLDDGPILRAMVVGGFAQIVVASLAYLGPVLRGGGHEVLGAGFALTRSWIGLAAANVAAVGALLDVRPVLGAGLAAWAVDGAVRGLRLWRGRAR